MAWPVTSEAAMSYCVMDTLFHFALTSGVADVWYAMCSRGIPEAMPDGLGRCLLAAAPLVLRRNFVAIVAPVVTLFPHSRPVGILTLLNFRPNFL